MNVKQGWEPLCQKLGKISPSDAFPIEDELEVVQSLLKISKALTIIRGLIALCFMLIVVYALSVYFSFDGGF